MAYRAPKGIVNHPAVQTCTSAEDTGAPDYRHYVELKDGWVMPRGHRNEGGGATFCRTVVEFLELEPVYVGGGFRQGDDLSIFESPEASRTTAR